MVFLKVPSSQVMLASVKLSVLLIPSVFDKEPLKCSVAISEEDNVGEPMLVLPSV